MAGASGSGAFVGSTSPVISLPTISAGLLATGSVANDFSSSTGTFLTSTGANTLNGAVTINDATTPSLTTAAGKTNTGFLQVNGKTSGALKITAADAAAQTVTVNLAAQTVGSATLTIPNMASVNKTLAWLESPAFTTPNLGTPSAGVLTSCTGLPLTSGVTGVLPVANGGTNASSASITAFNNITGYTAAGSTGTTSTNLVFSTSPTLVTPTLGAASATSLTFSSTTGIVGTTTNDNAAAGSVGEYVSSVVAFGSAVSLTTATGANVTSISLTAGDWDVWGGVNLSFNATTTYTREGGQISTTSATFVTAGESAPTHDVIHNSTTSGGDINFRPVGTGRFSLSGTTTIYLNARATFAVSTATAYGFIAARRRR